MKKTITGLRVRRGQKTRNVARKDISNIFFPVNAINNRSMRRLLRTWSINILYFISEITRAGTSKSLCLSPPPDMWVPAFESLRIYTDALTPASIDEARHLRENRHHTTFCARMLLCSWDVWQHHSNLEHETCENWLLEVSAKQTDKWSQRDKSRADPSENDAEHRLDQCSQSNQQVLMEDNRLSEHKAVQMIRKITGNIQIWNIKTM